MHHGDESGHAHESQHADGTRDENEPVGGTLGTTGTEGYGLPEQVVGDGLHTDERAQTAEESVTRGTVGAEVAGGFAVTGLGEDQPGAGMSPQNDSGGGVDTGFDRGRGEST